MGSAFYIQLSVHNLYEFCNDVHCFYMRIDVYKMCTRCTQNVSHISINFCIHFVCNFSCHRSFDFGCKMYTKACRNVGYILHTFCMHFININCICLV